MKTKEELEEAIKDTITMYKEIIFSSDSPTYMACLGELWKQQVIDQNNIWSKADGRYDVETRMAGTSTIIVMYGDTMINNRTGEVLDPEVDSTYWKDKF